MNKLEWVWEGFFFQEEPLFSLPLCALSHSDSVVARLRHLWPPSTVWRCFLHLQKAAFFFIHHLKFKRAEMETHALSIRGTPGAVWGTSYRSICTKTACISDVPWKQRRLLITSTNSLSRRTWREVEHFKSCLFVHVYLLFIMNIRASFDLLSITETTPNNSLADGCEGQFASTAG